MEAEIEESRGGLGVVLALVIVLPLAYVLAVGPTAWLFTKGVISEPTYVTVYAPLFWLADESEQFDELGNAYVELWIE